MALTESTIAAELKKLMDANASDTAGSKTTQDTADALAKVIVKAIKSATITIPTGKIQVEGTPAKQSNIKPIKLNSALS